MAFRGRHGYQRSTAYSSDAGYSRTRPPGPWQDQYQYYNDHDYAYAGYDTRRWDTDDAYRPYDYAPADSGAHAAYPESHPYAGDSAYQDTSGSQTYGEYYHEAAPSPGGYREGHGVHEEHGTYAPRTPPDQPSMPHHGQTRHMHHSHHPHHRERPRSPPAPPPPPPPPRAPSPAYLALAAAPPAPLARPADLRKLLILDLNGTLVFRAAYRPKHKQARTHEQGAGGAREDDAGPRLRTAHPRPYLPSFRNYLFARATRAWLDVMVWSSAQPHSVRGMVERVFGAGVYEDAVGGAHKRDAGESAGEGDGVEGRPRLLAVWARDTLGLSEAHYRQKVQTVKDLAIPWSKLPPPPLARRSSRTPTPPPRSPSPHSPRTLPRAPPPAHTPAHSALSTLLLDDSPLKAARQPHSHVCIPEYDARRRAGDLAALVHARARRGGQDAAPAGSESAGGAEEDADADAPRKRKRQEKKAQRRLARAAAAPDAPPGAGAGASGDEGQSAEGKEEEEEQFDGTLLAVVGVLDEVKRQRNVAAWIRAGGLWGPAGAPGVHAAEAGGGVDEGKGEEDGRDSARKKARQDGAPAPEGNDAGAATGEVQEGAKMQPMWFEDPETLRYWVGRGKRALEELGIAVEHGIER